MLKLMESAYINFLVRYIVILMVVKRIH